MSVLILGFNQTKASCLWGHHQFNGSLIKEFHCNSEEFLYKGVPLYVHTPNNRNVHRTLFITAQPLGVVES